MNVVPFDKDSDGVLWGVFTGISVGNRASTGSAYHIDGVAR
jgi:hypothetical protein